MMNIFLKQILIFSTVALFYGCSGHTLQELVDGDNRNKSSNTATAEAKITTLPSPSNNSTLQSISPSTTAGDDHEKYRYMQKNTNEWMENEWNPLTESNSSNEKNSNTSDNNKHKLLESDSNSSLRADENNTYTLQYYVDKASIYIENREKRDANKTKEASHKEMIETLPGIGKSTKR